MLPSRTCNDPLPENNELAFPEFNKIVACTLVQGTWFGTSVFSRSDPRDAAGSGIDAKSCKDRFQFSGRLSVHARG